MIGFAARHDITIGSEEIPPTPAGGALQSSRLRGEFAGEQKAADVTAFLDEPEAEGLVGVCDA
jgi:hypothetical protein